ncbi:hypothetical protein [Brachyspira hyodysenteriae]|uniref:hypothetical protein n=1 Tax=Brachyspira hyodysenteriae TaxID=159 RepID=UPI0022CD3549|nr:hypothetical protein [Brachyspira hyodysenteriae]MCZ9896311.1 hypothetical protein [Brachyspira hyodysenteriae]
MKTVQKTETVLIHKMEEVKEEIKNLRNDIKSYDTYLDNLSEDFIKIDLRIEKLENHDTGFFTENERR